MSKPKAIAVSLSDAQINQLSNGEVASVSSGDDMLILIPRSKEQDALQVLSEHVDDPSLSVDELNIREIDKRD